MNKHLFWLFCPLLFFSSCSTFYVVKQGYYQLQLVGNAQPIEQALRSPRLDAQARKKLILVQEVREFAAEHLGLNADKNYKNVNLDWDKIINNISASEPTVFKAYTWWFPIIGAVPYKGFFDEKDAKKEEEKLKKIGLDTIQRRVGGYSTLGFFEDPVWPSMLTMSDHALVELIIHELAHATFYIPYQTPFNETFANFVGKEGARLFIASKYGKESPQMKKIINYQENEVIFNMFFSKLFDELDMIYKSSDANEIKLKLKKDRIDKAKKDYQSLKIKNDFYVDWNNVNNAYLMSFKNYNNDEEIFVELFKKNKENFKDFIATVAKECNPKDPFLSLKIYMGPLKASL